MSGDKIEAEGIVVSSIRGVIIVLVDNIDSEVQAYLGGKMKRNKINVLLGDRVKIEISPYDTTRGIIVRRLKKGS